MKKDKTNAGTDRRSFLKLASVGVVGTGAAAVSSVAPAAAADAAQPKGDGYSETEHVRRYYELAKFM